MECFIQRILHYWAANSGEHHSNNIGVLILAVWTKCKSEQVLEYISVNYFVQSNRKKQLYIWVSIVFLCV